METRNKTIIQECSNCGNIWMSEKVEGRCPECDSYRIIIEAEWEELLDN